jgi:hypothetical protein
MTPDQLAAIRERLDTATPGAWGVAFVSLSAPDLRSLLDEVERLTADRDSAQVMAHFAGVRADNAERREQVRIKELDAAKLEVERLRGALEPIANGTVWNAKEAAEFVLGRKP